MKNIFRFITTTILAVCIGQFLVGSVSAASTTLISQASQENDGNAGGGPVSTTLVISQVNGGGGGTTGTYLFDYVEIKNISSTPKSLNGLSLYYGSATGQFASTAGNAFALPNVTLNPGQYYFVQTGPTGTVGAAFPVTPDVVTGNLTMSGTNGKIALVTTAGLATNTCGATATPCSVAQLAAIIDWVAYGAAGNGTAGNGEGGTSVNNGVAITSSQGGVRKTAGCTDTGNNNADFDVVTAPVPRNTATTAAPCSAVAPTTFPRSDFNGDGKTDLSVFRPSTGVWEIRQSGGADIQRVFGVSTDIIAPSDYDGDNKTDVAVFRASATAGMPDFYVLRSLDSTVQGAEWGTTGDVPVVSDFDGDNRDDFAVWRNSTGDFWVLQSTAGARHYHFGASGDKPVPGYFVGNDARADFGVYRPSNGTWYIADSVANTVTTTQWGISTDIPVFADYDGDGKDDIAVFRPSDGTWYIRNSSTATNSFVQFGASGDVPVPGDYDGDGKYDQAVYRGGTWYLNRSTSGFAADVFGTATDRATPRWFIPQ